MIVTEQKHFSTSNASFTQFSSKYTSTSFVPLFIFPVNFKSTNSPSLSARHLLRRLLKQVVLWRLAIYTTT